MIAAYHSPPPISLAQSSTIFIFDSSLSLRSAAIATGSLFPLPCGCPSIFTALIPSKLLASVFYSKYGGSEIKLDGVEYIVISQSEIMAIVK